MHSRGRGPLCGINASWYYYQYPRQVPLPQGPRVDSLKCLECFASLNGDLPRVVPNKRPVALEALKMYRRAHQGDGL